jgi:cell division protein FtsB
MPDDAASAASASAPSASAPSGASSASPTRSAAEAATEAIPLVRPGKEAKAATSGTAGEKPKTHRQAKPTKSAEPARKRPSHTVPSARKPGATSSGKPGGKAGAKAAGQQRKRGTSPAERARRLRERLVLEGAIHDPGDDARPVPIIEQTGPDRPTPARALSTRVITLSIILIVSGFTLFPATSTYLRQQGEYRAAQAKISEEEATKERLTDELKRWDDPEYVKQQARERIGQAERGETQYVVKGKAKPTVKKTTVEPGQYRQGLPWGDGLWDSVMRASTP